jgi:hypothetical protein
MYYKVLEDLESISGEEAQFIYKEGFCKVEMAITFYSFKAEMHEREAIKNFLVSLDAVGSIFFNFET